MKQFFSNHIKDLFFKTSFFYLGLFVFCITIFLTHYFISGQAVYGDGIGYYAHVRSWVVDGDWNYTNEYKHIYSHQNNNAENPASTDQVQIVATTKMGTAENHYSPGVAVMLLPFYLLAHGISVVFYFFGLIKSISGYGDIYQIITGIGAICYVVLGIWVLEKIIFLFTNNFQVSRITTASIFFATHLLYYGSFDVINSHFLSFFLMSVFYFLYIQNNNGLQKIFLLGIIGGLLVMNRLQDGAIIILWIIFECKNNFIKDFELCVKNISLFSLGVLLSMWPLLYHWQQTFDTFLGHTYVRNLSTDIYTQGVVIFGSFFHPVTGLFIKAPILLVSLLYFGYLVFKKKVDSLWFLFLFFCIQTVIITIQGGWFAAAYGGRMYISSLVFFALVLGKLFLILKQSNSRLLYVIPLFFSISNGISFLYFIFFQK